MVLSIDSLNPAVLNVEYAVRGELALKAEDYRVKLEEGNANLPFDRIINANITNPQQTGLDQPPLTFVRQVAALMEYPALAELAPGVFPKDVVARAKELSHEIGSVGAYSHSQGIPFIRKSVAKFISERDGYHADPNHIFLTAGTSAGASLLMGMLISSPNTGILMSTPRYPLYTATLAQYRGIALTYFLDESQDWSTSLASVEEAIEKGRRDGIVAKMLVVINPANPTGSMLHEDTQEGLVLLCEKYSLILLADEVCQANLHKPDTHPFTSFKKIVRRLQSDVPLFSFHSVSKGIVGECGRRGGYFECTNVSDEVLAVIYKMVSVGLCPPVAGQIALDTMARPPKEGDESYPLWKKETDMILEELRTRAKVMAERLDALPGMSCVDPPGGQFLFPRIYMSQKAQEAARTSGKQPDAFYALRLLDETGICIVPGSGFGQKDGEWHYRLTCLCPGVEEYVGKLESFHKRFVEEYGVA
ncbi:hypothetical protein APHAL10511_002476 [Amanita phalloides]|nr:hypothetical protein APHAL10511_002476 [Amanita phalloides]